MSDFSDLRVTWRTPRGQSELGIHMPKTYATSIDIIEANFASAKKSNEEIRAVFDINHTLGVFDHSQFTFYPGVLEELCELLKCAPVALISGDQLDVINQKLVPVLNNFLKNNYSPEDQQTIFKNLTIFAQTGISVLKICEDGPLPEKKIPAAALNETERKFILEQIIPTILYEYADDERFKYLTDEFNSPNTEVDKSIESHPLHTQCSSNVSIELSIFGIHKGDKQKHLKNLINKHQELRELRDDIIDRCSVLLEHHSVNAQLGGTTTVDFRKFDKAQAVYRYLAGLEEWEGHLTLIGVGDSFGPKGNDLAFSKSCSLIYDVSEHHQNAENALSILRLIRKYT